MQSLGNAELVLLILFGFSLLVQLFYYLFFYLRIAFPAKLQPGTPLPPVSVVICARDEEDNLRNYIPLVMKQDYPEFEVVVVDDCSSDNTEFLLKEFAANYPNFRFTRIHQDDKFRHGKKLALTVGIKSAKNECLVLTDADCRPAGDKWLAGMAAGFSGQAEVILGYGGFEQSRGLLNNLIRFDAMFIALQYLTFAMKGFPYMGVGRNLAYRRSLFFNNRGFASHNHLASGDDDLFIREVAHRKNTLVQFSPETHTRTAAKGKFSLWVHQKKRHLTTSHLYGLWIKLLLGLEPLTRSLFYILFVLLLAMNILPIYILAAFLVRWLLQLTIFGLAGKYLKEKYLLLPSLLYDFFLPYFYFGLFLANLFNRKRVQWS